MTETVAFDPGLGVLATALYTEAYIVENDMANMPQLSRKIRFYRINYKRIVKAIINNLAFYNGCLAWGYYLVNKCKDSDIIGNPYTVLTDENKANYNPTELVDFCIEYLPKLYSDMKYFNVKDDSIPANAEQILNTYREFVSMNEGFINAYKVSDIILPENLKFSKSLDEIKAEIDLAIEKKDILNLLQL